MWGYNDDGLLGLGDTTYRSSPVQVGSLTNWKQVSGGTGSTNCIKTDGTLWSWGTGSFGVLGLGDSIPRSSPVQVGSLTNWKQLQKKFHYNNACISSDDLPV
jgi:alpha-tubulin suppressor-like RCC1 family protein